MRFQARGPQRMGNGAKRVICSHFSGGGPWFCTLELGESLSYESMLGMLI